jgi:hypothetical protein
MRVRLRIKAALRIAPCDRHRLALGEPNSVCYSHGHSIITYIRRQHTENVRLTMLHDSRAGVEASTCTP